jgi:hypothetical protein
VADRFRTRFAVLLLAAAVLAGAARLRGAEYDEQYTLFLTAGTPRPDWPERVVTPAEILARQTGIATPGRIAQDLRRTDVHPPLYFWAAAAWRGLLARVGADGLFGTRLLSVGCALAALAALGALARRCGIQPAPAMLFTLGCYGFAYTATVARGFALAQMLTLVGLAVACDLPAVPRRSAHGSVADHRGRDPPSSGFAWAQYEPAHPRLRTLCGGLLLGAATLTNYLAAFVAIAAIAVQPRRRAAAWMGFGYATALPVAAWFYCAQRASRDGQFPPFTWSLGLGRLARYTAGNLAGGLPLYVAPAWQPGLTGALAAGLLVLSALVAARWRRLAPAPARRLLLACALAPPAGLLALGMTFDSTPIELRYLAFATPFCGMLIAAALGSLRRCRSVPISACLLAVQTLALAGLLTRPETMQPAQTVAREAARLAGDGVVLVPYGNDGVGIVGAFAREAPPELAILIMRRGTDPAALRRRLAPYDRVALAWLAQDRDSAATLTELAGMLEATSWRPVSRSPAITVFTRVAEDSAGSGAEQIAGGR